MILSSKDDDMYQLLFLCIRSLMLLKEDVKGCKDRNAHVSLR